MLFVRILELNALIVDVEVDFLDAIGLERRPTRQKLVGDDTKGPDINLLSIRLPIHQLRSHVKRRS